MNRKVQETIEKYAMLKQGDTVIVAVSGGADSVALLHLLCASHMGIHVRACHLNHCLRGEESERDEQMVRTMCREYGVPLDVRRANITRLARRKKQSVELAARNERYHFFEELSVHYGAKVATAHTLSDLTETVLFNLARGTGVDGLCGIPPVRGPFIRPLLGCSRQEVEAFCTLHDVGYVNDSTNDADEHARNYIRHHVVAPFMQINDAALQAVQRMTEHVREDAAFLREQAQSRLSAHRKGAGVSVQALREEPAAMRSRIIMQLLREAGIEVSASKIARAQDVLFAREGALCISRDVRVLIRDDVFLVEHAAALEQPVRFAQQALVKTRLDGGGIPLSGGRFVYFSLVPVQDYEIFKNNGYIDLKCALDYDKMEENIVLRTRKEGDRIRPVRRGCSKTLKKLYNELAVTERDSRCVLADRGGVLFAEGIGIDERVACAEGTQRILLIKIMEEWEDDTGYHKSFD